MRSHKKVVIDSRLKKNIDSLMIYHEGKNNECYSVSFKDMEDTFWFDDHGVLQEFLNEQTSERYYDKSLRKGYFTYINENNDKITYIIKSVKSGTLVCEEQ